MTLILRGHQTTNPPSGQNTTTPVWKLKLSPEGDGYMTLGESLGLSHSHRVIEEGGIVTQKDPVGAFHHTPLPPMSSACLLFVERPPLRHKSLTQELRVERMYQLGQENW